MTLEEAMKLAQAWTKGLEPHSGGWMEVIYTLMTEINSLSKDLHDARNKNFELMEQNNRLILDVALYDKGLAPPPKISIKEIAE